MKRILLLTATISVFSTFSIQAQSTAMPELTLTTSVAARGTGSSGLLTRDPGDAFRGNPANLIFSDPTRIGYYRDAREWFSPVLPALRSYNATVAIGEYGFAGVDYYNWDQEVLWTSDADPNPVHQNLLRRYFSAAYANRAGNDFAYGLQLTYAYNSFPNIGGPPGFTDAVAKNLFLSLGGMYTPDVLDNRLTAGISWMNIGTTVSYADAPQSDSPPTLLNLGISYDILREDFASLRLSVEATRTPVGRNSSGRSENSFEGIVDWHKAPRDIALNSAVAFEFKPVPLGRGVSYFQQMYAGYYAPGPKSLADYAYANGIRGGIQVGELRFGVGYAGMWYTKSNYGAFSVLPDEVFDFSISYLNPILGTQTPPPVDPATNRVIVTVGAGETYRIGRYRNDIVQGSAARFPDKALYQIDAAFYLSDASALVATFRYTPLTLDVDHLPPFWFPGGKLSFLLETFSLSSLYRYHPLQALDAVFLEAGMGITRQNPTDPNLYPKYRYRSFLELGAGALISITGINENIVLVPKFDFLSMLDQPSQASSRLGGYNQIEYGLKIGYEFR